jgi:phosphoglycolate phosphatase-like HAD superfamily hydrolase
LNGLVNTFIGSVTDKASVIQITLAGFGARHTDVCYIGDTVFDIRAAKKAGVMSVAVASGYHTHERLAAEKPDILVRTLTELQQYL